MRMFVEMVTCSDSPPLNYLAKVLSLSTEQSQKGAETEKLIRVDHSISHWFYAQIRNKRGGWLIDCVQILQNNWLNNLSLLSLLLLNVSSCVLWYSYFRIFLFHDRLWNFFEWILPVYGQPLNKPLKLAIAACPEPLDDCARRRTMVAHVIRRVPPTCIAVLSHACSFVITSNFTPQNIP